MTNIIMIIITTTANIFSSSHTYHLEERQVADRYVIEVDLRVEPGVIVGLLHLLTDSLVGHYAVIQPDTIAVLTLIKLSPKQIDSHDTEDEPKYEADQQHIEDGGNGLN